MISKIYIFSREFVTQKDDHNIKALCSNIFAYKEIWFRWKWSLIQTNERKKRKETISLSRKQRSEVHCNSLETKSFIFVIQVLACTIPTESKYKQLGFFSSDFLQIQMNKNSYNMVFWNVCVYLMKTNTKRNWMQHFWTWNEKILVLG